MEPVQGRTPLHEALAPEAALLPDVWTESIRTFVKALVRAGASPAARDCRGGTPVDYAISARNAAALNALLPHKTRLGRAELTRGLLRTVGGPSEGEERQVASGIAGAHCGMVRQVTDRNLRLRSTLSGMLSGTRHLQSSH